MNTAQVLVELLKEYRVEHIFGVPGDTTMGLLMDAVGIAEGFGIRGVRITDPDQLLPAITNALASNEPVFIDVPTISELEEVPPVHAWQQALKWENAPGRQEKSL